MIDQENAALNRIGTIRPTHPRDGSSKVVSNGDIIFTLIGFIGLYFVLGLLFLFLVGREIGHGPDEAGVASRGEELSL